MKGNEKNLLLGKIGRWLAVFAKVVVGLSVVAIAVAVWSFRTCSKVETGSEAITSYSPTTVSNLRSVGQWEFLSVSDELLIDTVRHGFFSDDKLQRIYYGTLRLGIDFAQLSDDALTVDGDSVSIVLPAVRLLDERFLDEAATRAFYEERDWSEAAKGELTHRAARRIREECWPQQHLAVAERNAQAQVSQFFRAMGYKKVSVVVGKRK